MGPYSESGEGAFDVDEWGCPSEGNGTLPPHNEAFFNLTVAVRAGAFPDVGVNGEKFCPAVYVIVGLGKDRLNMEGEDAKISRLVHSTNVLE